ncbi:hypothetical protein ON010_g5065 [Phytophthora cinnamomi]|nr:hypothetical protein ON010_g5065 [Phytophthora cinnamomi]
MENVPSSNNYEGGFAVALHRKDLGLAMDCAKAGRSVHPADVPGAPDLQHDGLERSRQEGLQLPAPVPQERQVRWE